MNSLRALLALAALGTGGTHAQQTVSTPAVSAKESAQALPFARYRAFSEEPVQPWRESNDTVRKIGGWQAYGREAQQDLQAPAKPEAPAKSPATPAPSTGAHSHREGRP